MSTAREFIDQFCKREPERRIDWQADPKQVLCPHKRPKKGVAKEGKVMTWKCPDCGAALIEGR